MTARSCTNNNRNQQPKLNEQTTAAPLKYITRLATIYQLVKTFETKVAMLLQAPKKRSALA